VLGGIVLCTVLAGCGSNGPSGAPGVDPPGSSASGAAVSTSSPGPEGVQRVTLEAVNSLYRPANISAHTGTIEITVKNRDKVLHNLTVAIGSGAGLDTIRGGTTASVRFTVEKPGQYHFFCSYHQGIGMTGELNVR